MRRIVLQHAAGPYPGLRQIVGLFTDEDAERGRIPDVLPAHPQSPQPLWPDGRLARCLRLKSNDKYVVYLEQTYDDSPVSV
jgi:hypothetical protein